MNDLYLSHLLHQHLDALRRQGEGRAAVRRALQERRADAASARKVGLASVGRDTACSAGRPVPAGAGASCCTAGA
jgi:hypothetical protein